MSWEVVIGLEVHVQLATSSKIFSASSTAYGAAPNTQACLVDLGMPGVLPVLNHDAVAMAVKFGLAVSAQINHHSEFARKNYFYADLPKGYQISQFDWPIIGTGYLDIQLDDGTEKCIGITRAHLEEDAGKSLHEDLHGMSGIDFNRAGTALLEIVSEPDMRSAKEAVTYLKTLHSLVRYLQICDGNMQEGSFRCDVNISLRPQGYDAFGTRTEIKNVNSFRFVERAIEYEIERQAKVLESGGSVTQETRLFDADKNETRSLRSKEEAHDYRYFPDPDLLPLHIDESFIDAIRGTLPELPQEKRERFERHYGLSAYDASILVANQDLADYFESVVKKTNAPKLSVNWVMGDLSALLNKENLTITQSPVSADNLANLIRRINDGTISGRTAKEVFETMSIGEGNADEIIDAQGLKQISDTSALQAIADEIIANNSQQAEQYRKGKDKLFGFFVGQMMKATQGKANPAEVNKILKAKL